jgi:hypothetical protein
VLAWDDVEGLALAEELLGVVTAALEVIELADELWLAETLDDEAIEALLDVTEELIRLLESEGDPEALVLDGKPWVLLERTLAALVEEETTTLWLEAVEEALGLWLEGVDETTLWLEAIEEELGLWLERDDEATLWLETVEEALGLWLEAVEEALELWLERVDDATLWLEAIEEELELWLVRANEVALWVEEATTLELGETEEELTLMLLDDEDAQEGLGMPTEYELSEVEATVLERMLVVLETVELALVATEDERLLWSEAGAETDAWLPLKPTAVDEVDGMSLLVDVAWALELLVIDADVLAGPLLVESVDEMALLPPATRLPLVSTVLL